MWYKLVPIQYIFAKSVDVLIPSPSPSVCFKKRFRRPNEAPSKAPDFLSLDNVGWYYKDLKGVEFGPFRSAQMRNWLRQGYFSLSMPIRLGGPQTSDNQSETPSQHEDSFVPLNKFFPVVAEAFPDSAQVGRLVTRCY